MYITLVNKMLFLRLILLFNSLFLELILLFNSNPALERKHCGRSGRLRWSPTPVYWLTSGNVLI